MNVNDFVGFEVARCRLVDDMVEVVTDMDPAPGDFWTLYGRLKGNHEAVALQDYATQADALLARDSLTYQLTY